MLKVIQNETQEQSLINKKSTEIVDQTIQKYMLVQTKSEVEIF